MSIKSGISDEVAVSSVAARMEKNADLVVGREKSLSLSGWLEPAKDLLPPSDRPMGALDAVVQPLVGAVVSIGRLISDRLDVAMQLVRDYDARLPKV